MELVDEAEPPLSFRPGRGRPPERRSLLSTHRRASRRLALLRNAREFRPTALLLSMKAA